MAQAREAEQRIAALETSAAAELEALRRELADRTDRFAGAEQEIADRQRRGPAAGRRARRGAPCARRGPGRPSRATRPRPPGSPRRRRRPNGRLPRPPPVPRSSPPISRTRRKDNADLNRRLQELEARRALETAAAEGRADLDDLLRVTQERLAGQTEKLIAAEERVHQLERDLTAKLERIDEVEGELRQQQMAEAMRQIRGEHETAASGWRRSRSRRSPRSRTGVPPRPFIKELSLDAKKSLSRILGLTQILKHKKDAKDQAQLIRQLTTYARRLDHVVSDMTDADELVRGTVKLNPKRTDLEALVQRVVEESGLEETTRCVSRPSAWSSRSTSCAPNRSSPGSFVARPTAPLPRRRSGCDSAAWTAARCSPSRTPSPPPTPHSARWCGGSPRSRAAGRRSRASRKAAPRSACSCPTGRATARSRRGRQLGRRHRDRGRLDRGRRSEPRPAHRRRGRARHLGQDRRADDGAGAAPPVGADRRGLSVRRSAGSARRPDRRRRRSPPTEPRAAPLASRARA